MRDAGRGSVKVVEDLVGTVLEDLLGVAVVEELEEILDGLKPFRNNPSLERFDFTLCGFNPLGEFIF